MKGLNQMINYKGKFVILYKGAVFNKCWSCQCPIERGLECSYYWCFKIIDVKKGEQIDCSRGKFLLQFNTLMHVLFENIKVFVYSSANDYILDVINQNRIANNLIIAIDYGDETSKQYFKCLQDLD